MIPFSKALMTEPAARPAHLLPLIILSQFACTTIWFAGNAVMADLQQDWHLPEGSLGYVTSAVQVGFIIGTLIFAVLAIADRFSPRKVFFACALAGGGASMGIALIPESFEGLLLLRFLTGFFLAGIYPVGMKIATGWFAEGLGRALGYLVGALVLGTALPHLLRALGADLPWEYVIVSVSVLAIAGGAMMLLFVPDGPHLPAASPFNPGALRAAFQVPGFRASAFGYFGHMWELYAFWAFAPVWLAAYAMQSSSTLNIPLWSFTIIAIGFFGCAIGGYLSTRFGSAKVAGVQLAVSGLCCLASPIAFMLNPALGLAFMLLWGITVIGDSPQFSALNAVTAPKAYVGSALTIANCIGFSITVVSIQLLSTLAEIVGPQYLFLALAPGPILGLLALRPLLRNSRCPL